MAVTARALAPAHAPPAPRPALRVVPPPAGRGPRASAAVYRRRRLAVVGLALLMVVGVWAAYGLAASADAHLDAPALETVVVAEADTVWGIAARHLPPGADLPGYVAEVLALNGVDAAALRPGTVLRLP